MTQIDSSRLEKLRTHAGLTQAALGKKCGRVEIGGKKAAVDKKTIRRIEAGQQQAVRTSTVARLAAALGVSSEVLTGQAPLPAESEPARAQPSNDGNYPINVRVTGAVRNAFSLVHMRYQVPFARIVELAPFLFVLAAEASLERRRAKLSELRKAFNQAGDLESEFPHLPSSLSSRSDEFMAAEEKSISDHDIWGDTLPDRIFQGNEPPIEPDYEESKHNPFVVYLQEATRAYADIASIRGFSRSSSDFDVCREDALELAGNNEELAKSFVDGKVILHKWLREEQDALFADTATEQEKSLGETAP